MTLWTLPTAKRTKASIPVAAVSLAASALFSLQSYFEHTRTVHPSFLLDIFLALTLLFDIAQCRTLWLRGPAFYGNEIAILFSVSVGIKAVLLVLESLEKRRYLRDEYRDYPPEATASIFTKSFFAWLNPLFLRGFSNLLEVDDLYQVDKSMLSDEIHAKMEEEWSKGEFDLLLLGKSVQDSRN